MRTTCARESACVGRARISIHLLSHLVARILTADGDGGFSVRVAPGPRNVHTVSSPYHITSASGAGCSIMSPNGIYDTALAYPLHRAGLRNSLLPRPFHARRHVPQMSQVPVAPHSGSPSLVTSITTSLTASLTTASSRPSSFLVMSLNTVRPKAAADASPRLASATYSEWRRPRSGGNRAGEGGRGWRQTVPIGIWRHPAAKTDAVAQISQTSRIVIRIAWF